MSKVLVCESCGGVAYPVSEEMEKNGAVCGTPGCERHGMPLTPKDLDIEGETEMDAERGGRFIKR